MIPEIMIPEIWQIALLVFVAGCIGGTVPGMVVMAQRNAQREEKTKGETNNAKRETTTETERSTQRQGKKEGENNTQKGPNSDSPESSSISRPSHPVLDWFIYLNPDCKTCFAGLVSSVLLGGLAALVYWGLYGPLAGFPILGSPKSSNYPMPPILTLGQLAASVIMGIGGPGFLAVEASRRCWERQAKVNGAQTPNSGE